MCNYTDSNVQSSISAQSGVFENEMYLELFSEMDEESSRRGEGKKLGPLS